jgi:3-methyladenine DNA glycosylase/8-oxoguanine DNA glycosylase
MEKLETIQIAPGPFSLKATALSHGWHECSPMSWSEGGRCLQLIERVNGTVLRVSVAESKRSAKSTALCVLIEGDEIDATTPDEINRRLRIVLGLDRDVRTFHDLCRDHPTLHVIPKIGAGRGIRSASMSENIIKALCATNVTWSQAVKMINRIGQLGPPLRHFVNLNAWPTPREILKAGERYLLEVCRVGYRAESILQFCRDVHEGRFDPELLDQLAASPDVSDDELLAKLRSIRGIGPSSAHYLLSFLGRHGRVSVDSATIAHVARTHLNGKKPTVKQVEAIYERYGRWRHLVWWYEHWLTWGTARSILREEGINEAVVSARRKRA